MPALRVPTLIVHGRHDATPTAMVQALAEAITGAQITVLNTGHFAYLEDPTGLLEAVSAFLTGLGR